MAAAPLAFGCGSFRWLALEEGEPPADPAPWSAAQIEEQLSALDGLAIDRQRTLGRFRVGPGSSGSGIAIEYGETERCGRHGWTQVVRESLDGRILLDPSVLPSEPGDPVQRIRWAARITERGFVVDGSGDGRGLFHPEHVGRSFEDDPRIRQDDLASNRLRPDARLYLREAETCVKCLNPHSDYRACLRWFTARVRGAGSLAARSGSYLVTRDAPEEQPSQDFREAVRAWSP